MNHVSYGLPGSQRCSVHMPGDRYLAVQPHALAPHYQNQDSSLVGPTLHVEYVKDGQMRGCCWMFPEQAMRLQVDLLHNRSYAQNWLILQLEGRSTGQRKASELSVLIYEPRH